MLLGCVGFSSLYEETATSRLISPEKDMIAVVYEGGAGATGANSSSVNIFLATETIASTSSTAIQNGRVFIIKENPEIKLQWKAFNELEIEYLAPKDWEIIEHKNHYLGVTVTIKHIEGMPLPPGQRRNKQSH